jgi:hypothetical protein
LTRTLVLFALGTALLLPFDSTIALTVGILLLLAAIVSGVFAVATPEFLGEDGPEN